MSKYILSGKLLEVNSGTYQDSPYVSLRVRSENVANNQIVKYKANPSKVTAEAANALLDKDVNLTFDIVKGFKDAGELKVVELVLSK